MTAGSRGGARPSDHDQPTWRIEHHEGVASELHAMVPPDDGLRRLWVLRPTGPALVLGSTQDESVVDRAAADAAGVEVVRRRSGGGAVWVAPGDPLWVDVIVPRGDPLWSDDVGRSFLPIGRAWSRALARVGVGATSVHEGPMVRTAWSDLVCFAGVGPGEVLAGTAKVVGMSQRRTRGTARFQCAVHRSWDPSPLRALLRARPPEAVLAGVGVGVGAVSAAVLVDALVEALTSPALP